MDLVYADSQHFEFFENKVRPILADNCYECHSGLAEPERSGNGNRDGDADADADADAGAIRPMSDCGESGPCLTTESHQAHV